MSIVKPGPEMKTRTATFVLSSALFSAALMSAAEELPMFGQLPRLAKEWIVHEKGTNRTGPIITSWMILTNAQTGDVLSFYEEKHGNKPVPKPTNQGPWTEMAISLFPGGYPAWNQPAARRIKSSLWGRNALVDLAKGAVAVESTTVWEEESGAKRLSHAFGLASGELRLYVQHTSANIITPEFAEQMADGLIELGSKRKAPTVFADPDC